MEEEKGCDKCHKKHAKLVYQSEEGDGNFIYFCIECDLRNRKLDEEFLIYGDS